MKILTNKLSLAHNPESDFEGAYRIQDFADQPDQTTTDGAKHLSLVHPERYIRKIKRACECKSTLAEIKLSPESFEAACESANLTVLASEQRGFAVIRPPGHHAGLEKASGFCLFNNIAIAAQKLVNEGKKVFILDIDAHHGDGTQSIFYKTDRVLFCSIHQEGVFPGTGTTKETGKDAGVGFTLNIPLLEGSGDKEFISALNTAITKAKDFAPDVVAVSAGFDGYSEDKLLNLNYSPNVYYECGLLLSKNFKNVFAVLEGGYHNNIRECVDQFVRGFVKHSS